MIDSQCNILIFSNLGNLFYNALRVKLIISTMKKDTGILLAGTFGVIIGITIFGFRKYIEKKRREYDDYYGDFHRNF